jgi:hypothetical protein
LIKNDQQTNEDILKFIDSFYKKARKTK